MNCRARGSHLLEVISCQIAVQPFPLFFSSCSVGEMENANIDALYKIMNNFIQIGARNVHFHSVK